MTTPITAGVGFSGDLVCKAGRCVEGAQALAHCERLVRAELSNSGRSQDFDLDEPECQRTCSEGENSDADPTAVCSNAIQTDFSKKEAREAARANWVGSRIQTGSLGGGNGAAGGSDGVMEW